MTTFWGDKGSCMDLGKFVVVIYDTVMQSHGVIEYYVSTTDSRGIENFRFYVFYG